MMYALLEHFIMKDLLKIYKDNILFAAHVGMKGNRHFVLK
jgi:hypothetical protein